MFYLHYWWRGHGWTRRLLGFLTSLRQDLLFDKCLIDLISPSAYDLFFNKYPTDLSQVSTGPGFWQVSKTLSFPSAYTTFSFNQHPPDLLLQVSTGPGFWRVSTRPSFRQVSTGPFLTSIHKDFFSTSIFQDVLFAKYSRQLLPAHVSRLTDAIHRAYTSPCFASLRRHTLRLRVPLHHSSSIIIP